MLIAVPTALERELLDSCHVPAGVRWLVCGAGPALSAMNIALSLERQKAKFVILAGIAGGYEGRTAPLDVVLAESEVFGDLGRCGDEGISGIGLSEDELPLFFSLKDSLTDISGMSPDVPEMICGQMVTVSCVSASPDAARRITVRFPEALCENMEGASAAMVCRYFNIPFMELRGISNVAGDIDRRNWLVEEAMMLTGKKLKLVTERGLA